MMESQHAHSRLKEKHNHVGLTLALSLACMRTRSAPILVANNAVVCPAVFYLVEQKKRRLGR
jgi:hypothetical protein